MAKLGVNIDHVATVRQARRTYEPDPVQAALAAELAGADGITVHLREDRRHIQDRDLRLLRQVVRSKLNLELGTSAEIVSIALEVKPHQATLVPERREEVTTEGGLDAAGQFPKTRDIVAKLLDAGIEVSLFLDPDPAQIEAAARMGAQAVELHTGQYALARTRGEAASQLATLHAAGELIVRERMLLHAGHGLNYRNVGAVAAIEQMQELNIGHAIVARSLFVGLPQAVREMKNLITQATHFPLTADLGPPHPDND